MPLPLPLSLPIDPQEKAFQEKLKKALQKNLDYIKRKDSLIHAALPPPPPAVTLPKKTATEIRNVVNKRITGIGAAEEQPKRHEPPNCSVYAAGFPSDITEEEVGILFSVLGKLKKIKLYSHPNGTKKGDALITFNKPEAVPVACAQYNGRDIGGGCVLSVSRANFNEGKSSQSQSSETLSDNELRAKLPAECLSDSLPVAVIWNAYDQNDPKLGPEFYLELESDLREEFSKFGRVLSFFSPIGASLMGPMVVSFLEADGARRCVDEMKDRLFDGRKLKAQVLNPPMKEKESSIVITVSPIPQQEMEREKVVEGEGKREEEEMLVLAPEVIEAVQDVEDFLNSLLD